MNIGSPSDPVERIVRGRGDSIMGTWVLVAPHGVYYVGLHDCEASVWRVALGWPSNEEIVQAKRDGWYTSEATIIWNKPPNATLTAREITEQRQPPPAVRLNA